MCIYLAGGSCLKHSEDLLPKSFTISNLELHYLFRQDFLAANLASFFASSVVNSKDVATCDGAQSVACALWQCPGSAGLGGAARQEPDHTPGARQLELQVLLHVAFLAAFFRGSLWAILDHLPASAAHQPPWLSSTI